MSALGNVLTNAFISPLQPSFGTPGNWWLAGAVMAADFTQGRYVVDGSPVMQSDLIANVNSSGGYVSNSDGHLTFIAPNLPRIGNGTGLLVEEERENIVLQSNSFNQNPWSTIAGLANPVQNVTGPDNVANSAWTFDDNSASHERLRQEFSASNNLTYTLSVYIKKDSDETRFPSVLLRLFGATELQEQVQINTATGAGIEEDPDTDGTFTITDAGDWWRIELSLTNNATGNTTLRVDIQPARGSTFGLGNPVAQGSAVFFGCQIEIDTFATSYIATGASSATRSADNVSFNDISWFTEAQGTFFIEFTPLHDRVTFHEILQADDGSNDNRISIAHQGGTNVQTGIARNGTTSASLSTPALVVGMMSKIAVAWAGDAAQSVDDSAIVSDPTVLSPIGITAIMIGFRSAGSAQMPAGCWDQIAFWPIRKPNDFLTHITI